ncbi:bleomycin hydrolase, partial [Chytridiales sp. JEL 0842]
MLRSATRRLGSRMYSTAAAVASEATSGQVKPSFKNHANAIVIGVYEPSSKSSPITADCLSEVASVSVKDTSGLLSRLNAARFKGKLGDVRLLFDLAEDDLPPIVSAVGLGKKGGDELKSAEAARTAAAKGISAVRGLFKGEDFKVAVDPLTNAKAAAEGAILTSYAFNQNKSAPLKAGRVDASVFSPGASMQVMESWVHGEVLAQAQNKARWLTDLPSNQLTPTLFS